MIHPIKSGFSSYVTQAYGLTAFARSKTGKAAYKNFPNGIHPGFDFGTHGINAPAISLVNGRVVRATFDGGWGNHVEILADDGFNRQYGHLSKIQVVLGQVVKPFDIIGLIGSTGASTGTHLHYGKRRKKLLGGYEYVDPSSDFDNAKRPTPAQKPPAMPKGLIIKGDKDSKVFVMSKGGLSKHHVPNWITLTYLFGNNPIIGIVDQALLDKLPEGQSLPILSD